MPKRKVRVEARVRVDGYAVVSRAVEEGVSGGLRRAKKYTNDPSEEALQQEVENAVVSALCEVLKFSDD